YGESWRKRQVIVNQREQENIEKMKTLRVQGFSYWKIAEVFNSMKVPTKTGRGRWHARAIQKNLENESSA
ncbi:MAG: recombinase family protein, partial [Bdellovibrionia bacterium]